MNIIKYLVILISFINIIPIVACNPAPFFRVESIDVTPQEVLAGKAARVSAKVSNISRSDGAYSAFMLINNKEIENKHINISAGKSESISFNLIISEPGEYTIKIGDISKNIIISKEYELKFDDGKQSSRLSTFGGHLVEFIPPAVPFTIDKVRIYGGIFPRIDSDISLLKNKTFDLQILNQNFESLSIVTLPYDRFPINSLKWVEFSDFSGVHISNKFYINVLTAYFMVALPMDPVPKPPPELQIGVDNSVVNEHSHIIDKDKWGKLYPTLTWPFREEKSKVNWMIRVTGKTSSKEIITTNYKSIVELKYDTNQAKEALTCKGGQLVDFTPLSAPFIIKSVKIAGCWNGGFMGGSNDNIQYQTFDLELLDKNLKRIYKETYTYNKFRESSIWWSDFEIPNIEMNDKFYVHIFSYNENDRTGLFIGVDNTIINQHSNITNRDESGSVSILPKWYYQPSSGYLSWAANKDKFNWMIRVYGNYTEIVK